MWVMNTATGAKIGHVCKEHEIIVRSSLDGALRAQGVVFVSAHAMQPSNTQFCGHVHGFGINLVFQMPANIADDIMLQFTSHGLTLQWV